MTLLKTRPGTKWLFSVILFVFIAMAVSPTEGRPEQQDPRYFYKDLCNGRMWKLFTENEKITYVAGVRAGISLICLTNSELEPAGDFYKLVGKSNKEISAMIDTFYEDAANVRIPVLTAYIWAAKKINGVANEELEELIAQLRRQFNNLPDASAPFPGQNQAEAQKASSGEINGFRGITWGTEITALENMDFLREDESYGGIRFYKRRGDALKIGAANLEKIEYGFWRGRLVVVRILTKGYTNFSTLKDAVCGQFGQPFEPDGHPNTYAWLKNNLTETLLRYKEGSEEGDLEIFSKEFLKKIREHDEQKAREGVGTGF
jgi:hypothetical protein